MALAPRHERLVRFLSLAMIVASATYIGHRTQARTDVTEEGLSRLTPETLGLIQTIEADRPVTVHAYVSEDVLGDYVEVRSRLLNILREMESKLLDRVLSRTPIRRVADPDEIASVVAFLASGDASYITGECIYADGGRLALNYTVDPD